LNKIKAEKEKIEAQILNAQEKLKHIGKEIQKTIHKKGNWTGK